MEQIDYVAENLEKVRQSLELGNVDHVDTASEEITDEFLLFAIESGLLNRWAESFPDPRKEPQIKMDVLLAGALAARFAKQYALRQSGYVLQSARVLGALGYSVKVTEPGEGVIWRGTSDNSPYSSDVWRKLIVKMEKVADKQEWEEPAKEFIETEEEKVKVRDRKSRREVKADIDKVDALWNVIDFDPLGMALTTPDPTATAPQGYFSPYFGNAGDYKSGYYVDGLNTSCSTAMWML
jgi:hypothetical protein